MKSIYLIIASQDFEIANHKALWSELASSAKKTVVVDIPADFITSPFRNKYRIKEARTGARLISDKLTVVRPLLFVRPEILPDFIFKFVSIQFWKQIKKVIPDYLNYNIKLIVYDARWIKILKGTHPFMKIAYYLFDEVRNNGKDNSLNKARYRFDEFACRNSDIIFAMTRKLADTRVQYNSNIVVLGNGSVKENKNANNNLKIMRSIAFIGNFRNWIDIELLEKLIVLRKDLLFVFAGPVEPNMNDFLQELLNLNTNTFYFGKSPKENMSELYKMFDGVIVPYKQNDFIQSTRPIKIVESIFSGTPVVTIPMDGYEKNEFIRFATSPETFSEQIDYILSNPICQESKVYNDFIKENSWRKKAKVIDYEFSKIL